MKIMNENQLLEAFQVEELESRFEMRAWITIYEPCDCDGDGCDDNMPDPDCGESTDASTAGEG
ncbi:MAG: hypothetical protein SH848_19510 [Saprospiraceae bacterium]|nr:hypothetical protein [Saprospiraceae bacterium]MDZ4706125.1 hypothetical protein [Saprospiraceae bacterium]